MNGHQQNGAGVPLDSQYSNFGITAEVLASLNFNQYGVPLSGDGSDKTGCGEEAAMNMDPVLQNFLTFGSVDLTGLLLPQDQATVAALQGDDAAGLAFDGSQMAITPTNSMAGQQQFMQHQHQQQPQLKLEAPASLSPAAPSASPFPRPDETEEVYTTTMTKVMDACEPYEGGLSATQPRLLCLWLTNSSIKPWFRPAGPDGDTSVSYGAQRLRKERTHPTMNLKLTVPHPEQYHLMPFRADHHPRVELVRCDSDGEPLPAAQPIEESPVTFTVTRAPLFQFLEDEMVVYYQVAVHVTCHDLKCTLFRLRIVCPSVALPPVMSSPLLIGTGANPMLPGSIGLPLLRSTDVSYIRVSKPSPRSANQAWSLTPSSQIIKIEGANFAFNAPLQLVIEMTDVEDPSNTGFATILSVSEGTVMITPPALRGPCEAVLRAYVDFAGSRLLAVGSLRFTFTPVPGR